MPLTLSKLSLGVPFMRYSPLKSRDKNPFPRGSQMSLLAYSNPSPRESNPLLGSLKYFSGGRWFRFGSLQSFKEVEFVLDTFLVDPNISRTKLVHVLLRSSISFRPIKAPSSYCQSMANQLLWYGPSFGMPVWWDLTMIPLRLSGWFWNVAFVASKKGTVPLALEFYLRSLFWYLCVLLSICRYYCHWNLKELRYF